MIKLLELGWEDTGSFYEIDCGDFSAKLKKFNDDFDRNKRIYLLLLHKSSNYTFRFKERAKYAEDSISFHNRMLYIIEHVRSIMNILSEAGFKGYNRFLECRNYAIIVKFGFKKKKLTMNILPKRLKKTVLRFKGKNYSMFEKPIDIFQATPKFLKELMHNEMFTYIKKRGL